VIPQFLYFVQQYFTFSDSRGFVAVSLASVTLARSTAALSSAARTAYAELAPDSFRILS
jgi:hypothetical protein